MLEYRKLLHVHSQLQRRVKAWRVLPGPGWEGCGGQDRGGTERDSVPAEGAAGRAPRVLRSLEQVGDWKDVMGPSEGS